MCAMNNPKHCPVDVSEIDAFFVDSHCHFDFDAFEQQTQQWQQCRDCQIEAMVIPGVDFEQWPRALALAGQLDGVVMAAGVHPWWVERLSLGRLSQQELVHARSAAVPQLSSKSLAALEDYLQHPYCVAVGECGLDYTIAAAPAVQKAIFEQQLQLACASDMPLIIHAHKSHQDILALLSRYQPTAGGVIHAFTGSIELAQDYWRRGFYLGIGGAITYPRAQKTRATVQQLPLEAMVLETDAPDMPLNGYQGQPNHPLRVLEVAQVLADLRGETLSTIAQVTTANSKRLFQL